MINSRRKQNWVAEMSTESHTTLSDIPTKLGGTATAMDPHELLESALAACTIITLQMYADRQKWNLESAEVQITIVKEGAETLFNREIRLNGNLTPEQKSRLMEIADKCPIHKLLKSKIEITTSQILA